MPTFDAQVQSPGSGVFVEVPDALRIAFERDDEAREAFESLAFTHRKEYARWIVEAKRDETRERRVAKALEMLRAGRTIS